MSRSHRLICDRKTLIAEFENLCRGDIVSGRMQLRSGEEHLLLDLVSRGVHLVPSAKAQLASKSKVFQAAIFGKWMVPETMVIYNRHQLLEITNVYHRRKITKVVLKQDRKNAGMGILLYHSIEDIYNQAAHNLLSYPFVIQPFIEESRDIRVVILGDYLEAYTRSNPDNFRNNLHCGGSYTNSRLSPPALSFCREVMKRGDFPYGHLDLMLISEKTFYLTEINLRGGLHGARISTKEYKDKIAEIERQLVDDILDEERKTKSGK